MFKSTKSTTETDDILLLKQQLSALKRENSLLLDIGKIAKVGGWEMDMVNGTIIWSSVTREIHEVDAFFEPDLQTGIDFYKPGTSRDTIIKVVNDALLYGTPFDVELEIVTAKGAVKWVRAKGQVEYSNGKVSRLSGIFQDIHEKKTNDLLLARTQSQFEQTFYNATIGMAIVSPTGAWLKVNKGIGNMLGYSEQELVQRTFQDITHPDDLEKDLIKLNQLVASKIDCYELEKRYLHKDGHIVYTILSVSLVRDEWNNPLHFIAQITDISSLKETEKKLVEERHFFQEVIDFLPINIYVKDLQSRKILANKKEVAHMGLSLEQIIGKSDTDLYPEKSASISLKEDHDVFYNNVRIINRQTLNYKKDGSELYFLISKIPLTNQDNQIIGLLGVSYDISERILTEKKMEQLLEVSNDQNIRLLNFAHIVSHNLRSQSANMSIMLELYQSETEDLLKEDLWSLITDASQSLESTVQNLNEIVETTTTEKQVTRIGLQSVILHAKKNIMAQIMESNIDVYCEVDRALCINGIAAYLDSIMLNFLTNAIKYRSADRKPFVKFKAIETDTHTIVTIQDNGIGIDLEKNKENLFGMYQTFHGNEDARGIGLFITKNQIEAMMGTIEVASTPGEGTTFTITFPSCSLPTANVQAA